VKLEPLDLGELIAEIVEQYPAFRPPLAAITIESPIPRVLGNKALATQSLSNLFGNGVKFVAPGVTPRLKVSCEPLNDYTRLWIEDNGIGIGAADRERIFEIFARVHPESRFEGTGIGLSIVKKAMHKMRGRVGVESELGKGSRFWLDFLRL
jgi:signal transduction histidine kinase